MNKQTDYYTKTMAKIYFKQGHYTKATEIYRYLLKDAPESQELRDLLSEVMRKDNEKKKKDREILEKLFSKWIFLQLSYDRIQKMKDIENIYKTRRY